MGLSELNQELVQIPFVAKTGFTAAFTERKLTAHTVLVGGVRQALTPQHLETLRIEFEHKVQMELSHFQLPTLTSNTDIREVLNKLKERYQAAETILEQFVGQKTSAAMAMQDTQQKLAQERQETALIYVQNSGGMNEDANSSQEAIESLLKMNLSLDAREPGTQDTLLHIAIRQGSRQIIDCLLHCGADLHAINANDISIMAEAVYGQDVHTIAYLISEGVALPPQYIRVVDRNANTLLHHAIHGAQYDLAMHLLEKGANLFAENTRGETPWQLAIEQMPISVEMLAEQQKFIAALVHLVLQTDRHPHTPWSQYQRDVFAKLESQLERLRHHANYHWFRQLLNGINPEQIHHQQRLIGGLQLTLARAHAEQNDYPLHKQIKRETAKRDSIIHFKDLSANLQPIVRRAEQEMAYSNNVMTEMLRELREVRQDAERAADRVRQVKEMEREAKENALCAAAKKDQLIQELERQLTQGERTSALMPILPATQPFWRFFSGRNPPQNLTSNSSLVADNQ